MRLRAFLAARPPERSTWEAKSQAPKARLADFVRKEVCGFANRRGGYLLLGAEERAGGAWELTGVRVPGVRELHDWIASLLRQLQPAPLFDVHEWTLDDGAKVAVIQAEPATLPPVSFKFTVYIRHGAQTIKADGPAIRRLAAGGQRAESRLLKVARAEATKCVDQPWTSFGLAIVRPGERPNALTDPVPEQVLYGEVERALASRYRTRTRTRMMWGAASTDEFKDAGLRERPQPTFRGWRAAWMTEQPAPPLLALRAPERRRPARQRPKINLQWTDRDIWGAYLFPANLASAFAFHMPVRRHPIESVHGDRAIANAALMLRALLTTEIRLGASEHEPLFIVLALREWAVRDVVVIERQAAMTISPVEWRRDVTAEAARKMHLTPTAARSTVVAASSGP